MTLAEALPIVSQLSQQEKLQLIEALAYQVRSSTPVPPPAVLVEPRADQRGSERLYGILAGLGPSPSAEEIDQERKEMWGQYVGEDP